MSVYSTGAPFTDPIELFMILQVTRTDGVKLDGPELMYVEKQLFHLTLKKYNCNQASKSHEWFQFINIDETTTTILELVKSIEGIGIYKFDIKNITEIVESYYSAKPDADRIYKFENSTVLENSTNDSSDSVSDAASEDITDVVNVAPLEVPIEMVLDEQRAKYQDAAVSSILDILQNGAGRCLLDCPTGYGKSVVNFRVIKALNPAITVIVTPRVQLNTQILSIEKYAGRCLDIKRYVFHVYKPSTGFTELKRVIQTARTGAPAMHKNIIITICYQSMKQFCAEISGWMLDNGHTINLFVADEAHERSRWGVLKAAHHRTILAVENQLIEKYLFMTATPTPEMLATPAIFGVRFNNAQVYELIQDRILCDFETIVKRFDAEDGTKTAADLCAFIWGVMEFYKKRKCVVYTSNQKNARKLFGMMKRTEAIRQQVYLYISDKTTSQKMRDIGFPDMEISTRDTSLEAWECNALPAIIITCDKLAYGYDNVNIDLLCFADPRQSQTAIRQIVGRGLRANEAKYAGKLLHIILPVYSVELDGIVSSEWSKIREYIRFIVQACGKDVIDGEIIPIGVNAGGDATAVKKSNAIRDGNDYAGDLVPYEVYGDLCTTNRNNYKKFIKFLREGGVYDVASYEKLKTNAGNDWMPELNTIRMQFKRFCFKDLNAPENVDYYETHAEAIDAYKIAKSKVSVEFRKKHVKSREQIWHDEITKINKNIPLLDMDGLYYRDN